jgi:hypothetical protein
VRLVEYFIRLGSDLLLTFENNVQLRIKGFIDFGYVFFLKSLCNFAFLFSSFKFSMFLVGRPVFDMWKVTELE